MRLYAYNAHRGETSGPLDSIKAALKWAEDHLPSVQPYNIKDVQCYLEDEGALTIGEKDGGEKCFAEDVVIYDADMWKADKEGYIDW